MYFTSDETNHVVFDVYYKRFAASMFVAAAVVVVLIVDMRLKNALPHKIACASIDHIHDQFVYSSNSLNIFGILRKI